MNNGEERDIGFTGDIKIPKEINNIRADIVAGLDLRELKYVSIGTLLAIVDAFIVFGIFKQFGTLAVLSPALCLAPFIYIAKAKKNGLHMEDWLMILYANSFKGSTIRTNEMLNRYEELEKLYESKFVKKDKISKKEIRTHKKELKQKMKDSPYKGV